MCQAWEIRFKDLQLVILCPQNWSSLIASPSPAGLLLVFVLVPSICHLLTISPSTTYPFIYLCMHPSIPPSIPSVHPFIPHPSIQRPIHSSTTHSLSLYPATICYLSCTRLSTRHCLFIIIHTSMHHLPTCLPSTHHQSSVHPSNYRSTAVLRYVRLATHPYVSHLPVHPPIHPLSILPSITHP